MGDDLYASRLRWYGYHGCAKLHGRSVPLHEPPSLLGEAVVAIDYVPEVGVRQIMRRGEGWRDMIQAEVTAADALLRVFTGGA